MNEATDCCSLDHSASGPFFTYLGYDGILGVIRQHAPGYPNAGQWRYYVHFPLAMLFLNVGLLLFARKMHIGLFISLWVLQLVLFVPFFLGYTGGM
jgi:hypothetical protein